MLPLAKLLGQSISNQSCRSSKISYITPSKQRKVTLKQIVLQKLRQQQQNASITFKKQSQIKQPSEENIRVSFFSNEEQEDLIDKYRKNKVFKFKPKLSESIVYKKKTDKEYSNSLSTSANVSYQQRKKQIATYYVCLKIKNGQKKDKKLF